MENNLFVDAHCHVGEGVHYSLAPEELLAQMDKLSIDRAVLCPADRFIAVENVAGNDYLLRTIERWPNRFWGFAAVNPWYERRAVAEVRRAIGAGLVGIKLDPTLQGFLICDELVHPVVESAIELDVPLYFSTGTPINGLPLQLAELAQRYPQANFIMGHMGNTDFWLDVVPAMRQAPNIWAETSYVLPRAINQVAAAIGPARLLFGSDAPMAYLPLEVEKTRYWDLSEAERAAVCGGNLLRLLGLPSEREK